MPSGSLVTITLRLLGASSVARGGQVAAGGLNKVGGSARGASKQLESIKGSAVSAGNALTAIAGAAITAGVAAGAKATIDFDKGMRNVNSIAQLSEGSLQKLEKRVLGLAGPTAQAPTTLAEGLYDLVSSGFNANQSMTILNASAKAATAGLTDTKTSTAAVAAVLNAYHLRAGQAGKVSDQLFQTVNAGVISFEDLANNIGDVLPFAATLHVGLGQVGASIATMTKEGISAPETMTRIKSIMEAMIKPGVALKKTLHDQGYESGMALIKAKGFQGALDLLARTTGGSQTKLAKLFPNVRALGGALALTGSNSKTAAADLKGMQKSGGATATALSQQSKSVSYQWNQLKAGSTAIAVSWGSKLIPVALKLMRGLGPLAQKVLPQVKSVFGQVMTALKPAQPFLQNVLIPLFKGFAGGIIGGVVVAFKLAIGVISVVAKVLGWLGQKAAPIKPVFQAIGTALGFVAGGPVLDFLSGLGKVGLIFRIISLPMKILEGQVKLLGFGLKLLGRGAVGVGEGFMAAFTFVRRFVGFMDGVPGKIGRVAVNLVSAYINGLERLYVGSGKIALRAVNAIKSVLLRAPKAMLSLGKSIGSSIINAITGAIRGAPQALLSALSWVIDKLPIPGFVKGRVKSALGIGKHASGGVVREPLQVVGERGPELAALPRGTRITPAAQTRRALRSGTPALGLGAIRPIQLNVNLSGKQIHTEMIRMEQLAVEAT